MRSMSSVLAAAAVILACDGATAPRSFRATVDDSLVPEALRAAYLEDAARLALRDVLARGYDGIPIPREAVKPYYDALVLVYNATGLPARDTGRGRLPHPHIWPAHNPQLAAVVARE